MKLEELRIYQLAMEMGEIIWAQVQKWDYFSKDTIVPYKLISCPDASGENFNPDKSGQRSQRYAEFIKYFSQKSVCLKCVSSFGLDTCLLYI